MPRLIRATPSYRQHKASGQAMVTIAGRDHYLGPWKSKASKVEYDRLIGEWLAAGRPSFDLESAGGSLSVTELVAAYWTYAKGHYVKNGKQTSEVDGMKTALRFLRQQYGHTEANAFGPLGLKALQQQMIAAGHTRAYINQNIGRIRRVFKWAVSEQLLRVEVYQALATVDGLRLGKTSAKEGAGVRAVANATVDLTLEHVPAVVGDMIKLQRLTGMRPAEVCNLRPGEVTVEGELMVYKPSAHKTMHHGQQRVVFIGPRAQMILRPYLLRNPESYCFVPAESEQKRRLIMHDARATPIHYGNAPGTNRKQRPRWAAGRRYDVNSYRRAITRGCELAFGIPAELREPSKAWRAMLTAWKKAKTPKAERKIPAELQEAEDQRQRQAAAWRSANVWSPNQLRHTAATEIRRRFGLDAAKTVLGHTNLDTTLVYAEADMAKAADVMREVG